jgi:outer membrane biosynthesis protein TonB
MNQTLIGCASLLGSLAVHTWVFLGNPREAALPRLPAPPMVVRLSVAPVLPEPTPPDRVVPALPEPPKEPKPKPARRAPEPELPDPKVEVAEDVELPEPAPSPELTGETLVSNEGQGLAAPVGNGGSRQGAIHPGLSGGTNRSPIAVKAASTRQAPRGPQLPEAVPLSQLSKRPVPPPLTGVLERNYPAQARSLGRSGEAKVRARVEADGAIRVAKVTSETAPGFGEACRNTLLSSTWSVPLDRHGNPASTWVTYQCKFRIGR